MHITLLLLYIVNLCGIGGLQINNSYALYVFAQVIFDPGDCATLEAILSRGAEVFPHCCISLLFPSSTLPCEFVVSCSLPARALCSLSAPLACSCPLFHPARPLFCAARPMPARRGGRGRHRRPPSPRAGSDDGATVCWDAAGPAGRPRCCLLGQA